MANIWVQPGGNAGTPANFSISIVDIADKSAQQVFVVEVGTRRTDRNGNNIPPIVTRGSATDLNKAIENAISSLCEVIDWGVDLPDSLPPMVVSYSPQEGQTVPLQSAIAIRLAEALPSRGINMDSIRLRINGIQVQPIITGTLYDLTVSFRPFVKE